LLLKEQEEPEEAEEGQGEIQMLEANPDLVQEQLSELAQQIVHVIEACNEEKDILKEDFDSVRNGILIMESRLQTEKTRVDSEVQGVGSMMNFQQAVLGELRSSIHVLQDQDNQIVTEATDLFSGFRKELEILNKKVLDLGLQTFGNKVAIQAVQKTVGILSRRMDEVTAVLATVTDKIKDIPSKQELRQFQASMDESKNQLAEANTGLTTALEQYKFSESTPLGIPQSFAGPSGTQPFIHPQRAAAFYSPSVSSLRDTASEYSWRGGLRGGAGSAAGDNAAGDGAVGDGAAGNGAAGDDAAGNDAAGGGGPPPPPDPPPSHHGRPSGGRPSRRQRRIKDLECSKPIKIKEPKKFYGKPGEDFDTWWVLVQVYIKDQPERFPEDERTIDWIGSLMDSYASSWHIQWLKGTLSGLHPKSMTGYVNALKLRFEDRDAKDEAYAELEKVRYEGCIRDMFTQIQTLNDKAAVTGAAFKKLVLERLPHKILEQMHTVDLTGRTDQEIMTIITNAGRTAEKWEAARNNLGLKNQFKAKEKALSRFQRKETSHPKKEKRTKSFERKIRKKDKKPKRDNSQTEGIESSEIQRRRSAGECLRCAWPSDRKGSHRVADCRRPIKLDKGTAAFPKAKEYQKMKIAGMRIESDSEDSNESNESDKEESESEGSDNDELDKEESESEGSDDEESGTEEQSEGEYPDDEKDYEQQEEEEEGNWWDSPPDSQSE